jgi:hypothetical protein
MPTLRDVPVTALPRRIPLSAVGSAAQSTAQPFRSMGFIGLPKLSPLSVGSSCLWLTHDGGLDKEVSNFDPGGVTSWGEVLAMESPTGPVIS